MLLDSLVDLQRHLIFRHEVPQTVAGQDYELFKPAQLDGGEFWLAADVRLHFEVSCGELKNK